MARLLPLLALVLIPSAASLETSLRLQSSQDALCKDQAAGSSYFLQAETLYLKKVGTHKPDEVEDAEQVVIDNAAQSIEALHNGSNTSDAVRIIIEDAAKDVGVLKQAADQAGREGQDEIANAAEDIKESAEVSIAALKKTSNSTNSTDSGKLANDTQATIHVSIRIQEHNATDGGDGNSSDVNTEGANGSAASESVEDMASELQVSAETADAANASQFEQTKIHDVEKEVSRAIDGATKDGVHSHVDVFIPVEDVRSQASCAGLSFAWLLAVLALQ